MKTSAGAAPGAFAAEAPGLRWLAEPGALALPGVLVVEDASASRFLALAWIDAGAPTSASEEALGRGLAALHAAGAPAFGGPSDTLHVGPLALPNEPADDWPAFYAARRLEPLARLAADRVALWQLAPLLLHAALFGSSWGLRATAILRRYA